jgi:hypothetical protein
MRLGRGRVDVQYRGSVHGLAAPRWIACKGLFLTVGDQNWPNLSPESDLGASQRPRLFPAYDMFIRRMYGEP